MKKIIALAFSLILVLTFAACGENSNTGDNMSSGMDSIGSKVESAADGVVDEAEKLTSSAKITSDEAKAAALKHAGLSEADVTGLDIDLDRDGNVLKYEIDFHSGGIEYDYDINAKTGEIISADKERE